jgi:hypothetical protein
VEEGRSAARGIGRPGGPAAAALFIVSDNRRNGAGIEACADSEPIQS